MGSILNQQNETIISSSLTVWFLSFDLKINPVNWIAWFFNMKYDLSISIFIQQFSIMIGTFWMYFDTLNLAVLLAVVHLPSGWKVIVTNQFIFAKC